MTLAGGSTPCMMDDGDKVLAPTSSTQSACPEIAANAAPVLIPMGFSLFVRQIAAQSRAFEKESGFTEGLVRGPTASRKSWATDRQIKARPSKRQ